MAKAAMETVSINLGELSKGMPALTRALGMMHAECAAVSLNDHSHPQGIRLSVNGDKSPKYLLYWPKVTPQMKRAYADIHEATERGACGVALLLVKRRTGFKVIERAVIGTGFDYWIGTKSDRSQPMKGMARLEVSGIHKGTDSQVQERIEKKKNQTKRSDRLKIKAIVVVVEFGSPQAHVVMR